MYDALSITYCRLDVTSDTADCEMKLDGFSTWHPAADLNIIHTPVSALSILHIGFEVKCVESIDLL